MVEMGMTCVAQAPPPCWMELWQLLSQILIPAVPQELHIGVHSLPTLGGWVRGKVALNVSNGIGLNE